MSTFPETVLLDGARVPGLAFGVGTAHYGKSGDGGINAELKETVKTALQVGYRHFDLAEAYGNEASVGAALAESDVSRDELFITHKVAAGLKDGKYRQTVEAQLKKVGVDAFDLYLIHWPYDLGKDGFPTILEAWKQLEELREAGLVKSIGVSNFRKEELQKIVEEEATVHLPTVNQIEFHPYVYSLPGTANVVTYAREKGIHIEAYGPTGPLTKLTGGPLDPILTEIASSISTRAGKKIEPSQVLLKLAQQEGAIVITTSGKDWRMKEQLSAGGIPELTEEERGRIKKAAGEKEGKRRIFMQHMDEKVQA